MSAQWDSLGPLCKVLNDMRTLGLIQAPFRFWNHPIPPDLLESLGLVEKLQFF